MTALSRYRKLECTGLWQESPEAQRREVFVALGEATLVITDPAGRVLSAWSLAAIEPQGRTGEGARFHPGTEGGEEIEITDPDMIEALERVNRAILRARHGRGKPLRRLAGLAAAMLLALGVALWLPDALRDYAARSLPESLRARLGAELIEKMAAASGAPACRPEGRGGQALTVVARAVAVPRARLAVLPGAGRAAWALPGGRVAIGGALLDEDSPDRALAALRAAGRRAAGGAPLDALLGDLGTTGTVRLLAAGEAAQAVMGDHARRLLASSPAPPAKDAGATIDDRHWLALRAACGR